MNQGRLKTASTSGQLAAEYGRAIATDPKVAHQRFGQWVCNTYLFDGCWPELFYANNTDAFRLIDAQWSQP